MSWNSSLSNRPCFLRPAREDQHPPKFIFLEPRKNNFTFSQVTARAIFPALLHIAPPRELYSPRKFKQQ